MSISAGNPVSKVLNGSLAAFRFVAVDPDNDDQVKQSAANDNRVYGVGPKYAATDGQHIPVDREGTHEVEAGGSITRGQRVKSDANGKAVAIATSGTVRQNSPGIAERSASSGDIVPISLDFDSITPDSTIS